MRQCRKGHVIPERESRCRVCFRELNRQAAATYRDRNRDVINERKREQYLDAKLYG